MSYNITITEETSNVTINGNTTQVSITNTAYPIALEYNATVQTGFDMTGLLSWPGNLSGNSLNFINGQRIINSGGPGGRVMNITANVENDATGIYLEESGVGVLYANTDIILQSGDGSTPNDWTFGQDGQLTAPGNISSSGNISATAFIGSGASLTSISAANITGTIANAGYADQADQANTANVAYSIAGANVTGYVANATHATTANVANSVSGGNVSGAVDEAVYATSANNSSYADVAVYAETANVANSVSGANVSGTVANATYALNANSAVYSTDAIQANVANVANSVAGANVSGTVDLAQYVTASSQANITSVGTLTSLSVTGDITGANVISATTLSITGDITSGNISANNVQATAVYNNGFGTALQSNYWAQLQYSNSAVSPVDQSDIGDGAWFYIDNSGAQWQSNTTGTVKSVGFGNDGSISAQGNVTGDYLIGTTIFPTLTVPVSDAGYNNVTAQVLKFNDPNQQAIIYGPEATTGAAQRMLLQGAPGADGTTGEGGDVYIWAGRGGSVVDEVGGGDGGDVKVRAGQGRGGAGGGYIKIQGGDSDSGTGGPVDIQGGDGTGDGGYTRILSDNNNERIKVDRAGVKFNAAYTFPNSDGTTDQFLTTNGSGVLGWSNVGSADLSQYVTQAAQANITSLGTLTSLSVSGNISTGNLVMSLGGEISEGTIPSGPQGNTIQIRPSSGQSVDQVLLVYPTSFDSNHLHLTSGNSQTTELYLGNDDQYVKLANTGNIVINSDDFNGNTAQWIFEPNANLSAAGNVIATAFFGDGSQLANITAGNITGTVANATYADTANAATYADQATIADTANAVAGANVSGTVDNATTAVVAGTVTDAAQANITSVGTLTSLSVTGNITGNYILGNGSQLTGLPATYSNTNATSLLAAFGSNTISTTGNVSGNYFIGNGSQLTGLPTTYTNTNATVAATSLLAAFGSNTISTTGNATFGNITDTGSASVTGNISAGNVVTGGLVSAAGNITGNYILGNGSQLTGIVTSSYSNTNAASLLAAFGSNTISTTGNATFGNITDTGSASVTGNVTGGNLIAVANLTSTQQTIIGTGAYVGNTAAGNGNIIISGRNIATDIAYNPGNLLSGSSTVSGAVANGRIVIGTGVYGNTTAAMDINGGRGARLLVMDAYDVPVTTQPTIARGFMSQMYPVLTGNVIVSTTRLLGGGGQILISGGSAGNTYNVGTPLGLAGLGSQVTIGGISGTTANLYPMLGNTSVGHAAGILSSIAVNNGNGVTGNSSIGNAFGTYNQLNMLAGAVANVWIGMASAVSGNPSANSVGNIFGIYNPNSSPTYGISNANAARAATNYYFLRNDDAVAQNQLGSLRSYTNYNYISPTTSGALTIDKTNSQVQRVNLTGNVTAVTFSNFVSSASDSAYYDQQEDTVRVYFNQGATGNFGITMPTGNSQIKYANGVSTISVTANTVTQVEITAITLDSPANLATSGTTTYLVNISPAYS